MDELYTNEQIWDAIYELSDIRAGYNLFDERELNKYGACCTAIWALRKMLEEKKKQSKE